MTLLCVSCHTYHALAEQRCLSHSLYIISVLTAQKQSILSFLLDCFVFLLWDCSPVDDGPSEWHYCVILILLNLPFMPIYWWGFWFRFVDFIFLPTKDFIIFLCYLYATYPSAQHGMMELKPTPYHLFGILISTTVVSFKCPLHKSLIDKQ